MAWFEKYVTVHGYRFTVGADSISAPSISAGNDTGPEMIQGQKWILPLLSIYRYQVNHLQNFELIFHYNFLVFYDGVSGVRN